VSGSQFPAGTVGTVRRVGDPTADGSDFITVRVKIGNVTDELRFSPKELSLTGKRRAATPAPVAAPGPARRTPRPARRPRSETTAKPGPDTTAKPEPARAPAKAAASPRRAAPVPAVTVTIASAGSAWTVSAQRGARVVVKRAAVAPGVVAAVAALLDEPAVTDAVAAVNDTARGEAEARAERLRAELAEVEAVLSSHRRP
jgi:hypothetical protein